MKSTGMSNDQLIEEIRGIRRIVINKCFGGFGLSTLAEVRYCELTGMSAEDFVVYDINRDDPALVQVVREFGPAAGGSHAELKIVEIPADVDWEIAEYDGNEWVAEVHRTWS
jgi:hypothetical protein